MSVPPTLPNRPDPVRAEVERALAAGYELDREIGRGGMGIVYRARDRRLKRLVAIKLLPPELGYRPEIRSRFLREAETAAQLSHPNIVPIYTVDEAGELVYFIMGYVEGETLAQRLQSRGPLPADEARRVLREVAEALAYAHARGVIHRDVKPDNILLEATTGRAIVTDFGIARAVSETADVRLTTTGVAIGTPAYMSPEQSAGDTNLDLRSDLYSLGVVGYQMLCGELPFDARTTPAMLVKHLSETPRPLSERCAVPKALNDVVMCLLAKDPTDRFGSAADLVAALDAATGRGPAARLPVRALPHEAALPQLPAAADAENATMSPESLSVGPDPRDVARWEAGPVRRYRRKLVRFFMASAAMIPIGVIGHQDIFFFISGLWGVRMALGYGRLWESGYDWRDVFRQTRDRLFVDMVGEQIDDTRALFDPARRATLRARMRARAHRHPGLLQPSPPTGEIVANIQSPFGRPVAPATAAPSLPAVREAAEARTDIHRLMGVISKDDRALLPDVGASADALYARIELLASAADELARADVDGVDDAIEREITELEAEANPLDEEGSERRVRRLAQLKRQRVSLRDLRARRITAEQKLDRCLTAMRSMRTDLVRLSTGSRSYESVTNIANQAMQLGREVDAVLYARDEVERVLSPGAPR